MANVAREPLADSSALAGCIDAQRLCRRVAAEPYAPLTRAVVGPGGSGKTALLGALTGIYERAGVPVVRAALQGPALVEEAGDGSDAAVLVDDVHQLDGASLERLHRRATAGRGRLVVAHRPWPRAPELSALGAALARLGPPVVLGHLDRAGTAARATALLDAEPSPALVDLLCELTGGLPALVDRLVGALYEAGGAGEVDALGTDSEAPLADGVPSSVLEQFRYDLDGLNPAVYELLLAVAVNEGTPVAADTAVLAPLLGLEPRAVADVVEAARATGLLLEDGTLAGLARQAILRLTPMARIRALGQRLAESQLDHGRPVLVTARGLLETQASGPRVAAVLEAAGDEALREASPLAGELLTASVAAGAPASDVAARRAQAAALDGDLDTALRLADEVIAERRAPDRVRAATVAAAVLARRGVLARSAELYRWLGTATPEASAAPAVPALIGIGALDEARTLLTAIDDPGRPPTLLAGAESLMASGMYETVAGSPTSGLSQLVRATGMLEPSGSAVLLPDTPAALAALVAVHYGEFDIAGSVLDRAVATGLGGRAALPRHRLLQAWAAMVRGDTAYAQSLLARTVPPGRLEPRDELVAAALEVGLARRRNDVAALESAWLRARQAIAGHAVDLFALQPLGELAVAAARVRDENWITPHLREAQALLERLGDPPLWSVPLHWYRLHAAITAEQPPRARHHATALASAAPDSPYAAALAEGARCWLRVLAGDVDPSATEAAARGLRKVGLTWEGARLAGQAALRTSDRKAMVALLSCARALHGTVSATSAPASVDGSAGLEGTGGGLTAKVGDATEGALSEREREVGELVLAGLTYKEIGERLFISAKTVEHHMFRIRRRLGAATRSELFTHLRALIHDPTS